MTRPQPLTLNVAEELWARALADAGYEPRDLEGLMFDVATRPSQPAAHVLIRVHNCMRIFSPQVMVRMRNTGQRKIHCIKILRQHLGIGLKDAKDLVDSVPVDFKAPNTFVAEALVQDLRKEGAKVDIGAAGIEAMAEAVREGGGHGS